MAYIALNAQSKDIGLITITLTAEYKPFTFIIDTGSNVSHIDETAFKSLKNIEPIDADSYMITGVGGTMESIGKVKKKFRADIFTFEQEFFVTDLFELITWLESEGMEPVHGILGTDFLFKYRCHLDFKKNRLHLG